MQTGVSVTRAMKFKGGPAAFTVEDGTTLLVKVRSLLFPASRMCG